MRATWKTKYGPRRVKHDPPTLQEALFAAKGMTDDFQSQIEIAASLMGVPADEVKAEAIKTAAPRRTLSTVSMVAPVSRNAAPRAVVVERKVARRPLSGRV